MDARTSLHARLSTEFAALTDAELAALVDAAPLIRRGIGGAASALDFDGTTVFVKQVPLTALEQRARTTANVFGLPGYYQYGVGSAGFGVWRELAAHETANRWVLGGECASFPLLYHWRVLPGPPPDGEPVDLEFLIDYWGGTAEIRARLEGIARADARVVLAVEYVPQTLEQWLRENLTGAAIAWADEQIRAGIRWLNARGALHFDAHLNNLLTDGQRLYFADFGLLLDAAFSMTESEREFFARHHAYDRVCSAGHWVNWLVRELVAPPDRDAYVREVAAGRPVTGVPDEAAAIIVRDVRHAAALNDFFWQLKNVGKTVPYPFWE